VVAERYRAEDGGSAVQRPRKSRVSLGIRFEGVQPEVFGTVCRRRRGQQRSRPQTDVRAHVGHVELPSGASPSDQRCRANSPLTVMSFG
jgi:hypothetical protein